MRFTSARSGDTPLQTRVGGGFVTGEGGIGHVAVTSKKPQQIRGYYDTVFDARFGTYTRGSAFFTASLILPVAVSL